MLGPAGDGAGDVGRDAGDECRWLSDRRQERMGRTPQVDSDAFACGPLGL